MNQEARTQANNFPDYHAFETQSQKVKSSKIRDPPKPVMEP